MESSGNEQVAEDITEFMTVNDIDLTELKSFKGDNPKNPFLCYLNINSLRYKITNLRHILEQTGIEIVAVSEAKLSKEFPFSSLSKKQEQAWWMINCLCQEEPDHKTQKII